MSEEPVRGSSGGATAATIAAVLLILLVMVSANAAMGRTFLGPDGRFGFWEGNIWSSAQSQRVADPYSFTHVEHGFLFYGLLHLLARRVSRLTIRRLFVAAVLLEASWEVLENSPLIIDRYRAATIALGYEGDSILNSLSDVCMMSLGFLGARRLPVWASVAIVVLFEVALLVWVRDNLALNILMLIRPMDAVKAWQMAVAP